MTTSTSICPNDNDYILRLIPQRKPFRMVDQLVGVDGETAYTSLAIGNDNYFVEGGVMSTCGLIEHIAQSASAMAGHKALQAGAQEPPQGILAEVKHFLCHRQPRAGETLSTQVTKGVEVAGVAIVTGETRVGDELIAQINMKIYIPQ